MINLEGKNWLWQCVREYPKRQALRKDLLQLISALCGLTSTYELPDRKYSRMVGNRIQNAFSDYWRAVEALNSGELRRARRMGHAARLEVDFIRQLMEAEDAEQQLGEGQFFEYADDDDGKRASVQIEVLLRIMEMELLSMRAEIRGHEQP